jgi:hypothetical protein
MNKAGHPYLLRVFSTILFKMDSADNLDNSCEIILYCLELKRLSLIDRYLLDQICLIICGKISISINKGITLKENVFNLMEFMIENEMVNKIFEEFIKEQIDQLKCMHNWEGYSKKESDHSFNKSKLETINEDEELNESKNPRSKKHLKKSIKKIPNKFYRPTSRIESALYQNLLFLFDLKDDAEMYFKKNFGYSLLDLEGNIIWADKRTCTTLDLKSSEFQEEDSKVNLFDLMIPPSRQYLKYKFSNQLFNKATQLGDSISMSYVIYSRVAMEKCKKVLVKLEKTDVNFPIKKNSTPSEEIFTKYLKSITSRASLTLLSFSSSELLSILNSDKCQFEKSKFMIKKLEKESKIMKNNQGNRKLFIFLESRLSEVVPNFNYNLLQNDPKILDFKNEIKRVLDKKKKLKKSKAKKAKKSKKSKKQNNLLIESQDNQKQQKGLIQPSSIDSVPHNIGLAPIQRIPNINMFQYSNPVPEHKGFRPPQIRSTGGLDHHLNQTTRVKSFEGQNTFSMPYRNRNNINNGGQFVMGLPMQQNNTHNNMDFRLLNQQQLGKRNANMFDDKNHINRKKS